MSLEQAILELAGHVKSLVTIIQTYIAAGGEIGGATPDAKPKRGRAAKDEKAGEPVYWLIEKHNTVYEQKPGDIAPSIEGAVQVTKEVYEAKKLEYAALVKTAIANTNAATQANAAHIQPTAEAAPAPAPAVPEKTPAASAPSAESAAPAPQASTAAPSWEEALNELKKLNASTTEGHGRAGVMKVLQKFLPNEAQPSAPMLAPLGKNAEIIAEIKALMAPAAEYDPLG